MDLTGDLLLVWVAENTLVCSVLAGVVYAFCRWRKPRAAICHALWLCVAIKLVVPPFLLWSWFVPVASSPDGIGGAATANAVDLETIARDSALAHGLDPIAAASAAAADTALAGSSLGLGTLVALGVWMAGAGFLVARQIRRSMRFKRLLRQAVPAPAWIRREARDLCESLRLQTPRLRVVPGLGAPCAGGLTRPAIFWSPRLLRRRDRHRVRAVLAHELAHIKRWDHLTSTVEFVATLFWWWHPLLWVARRQIHEYSEQACDLWALELGPISPREYADTLINFSAAPAALTAVAVGGSSPAVLRRRLTRVMRGSYEWRMPGRAVAAMGIGMVLLLPSWLCREAPWTRLASWSSAMLATESQVAATDEPATPAAETPGQAVPQDAPDTDLERVAEESGADAEDSAEAASEVQARVEARRVLAALIRLRAKVSTTDAIADDIVAAYDELGAEAAKPLELLRSLEFSHELEVGMVVRRVLRKLADRH